MGISTAVDAAVIARVLGIQTQYVNLRKDGIVNLPQRIAVIGQGNTAATFLTTKRQVLSAFEAGTLYGFGSPIHRVVQQLLPVNGDGVGSIPITVYPIDDAATGVAAAGSLTPSGTQASSASYRLVIGGVKSETFVIAAADSVATRIAAIVAAVNAVADMPVTAADGTTDVDFTSKWKGVTANDIKISVEGVDVVATTSLVFTSAAGTVFTIIQPTGGLVNPAVTDALAQVGSVWETLVINCFDIADTDILDDYSEFGEGRWGSVVRKPCVVFTGNLATTVANAIAVPDARKTDRTNAQIVCPGSLELPWVVAARGVARIAVVANNNPPRDYCLKALSGITPGADASQWLPSARDTAVKGGSSTIEVIDGVVRLSDTVTFYHPTGDPTPAYRYVVDIVKLQNIIFNVDLIFATDEWAGAPLLSDDTPTVNPTAKKPSSAITAINALIDSLALAAVISDPATAKKNTVAGINGTNPKRLDAAMTVQLSGNTNVISIDLNFGFYFGGNN